jgi:hypothetical protein
LHKLGENLKHTSIPSSASRSALSPVFAMLLASHTTNSRNPFAIA